ncbi:MAG TPA: 2'-5' RNA ligase family protein [Candidatus Saccharimonadales bacterium]|nr:2'-5' RNA ligase family protein [Candidatus Saccharimonadales bacterium]
MIEHRSYIVAEIPEPVRSQVQALRDSLNTLTAKLPVEITLAGSSGVGPVPAGADLSLIERHLDRTLLDISPFRVRISAIRAFPNTAIFFLEPLDRSPFDHLHQKLRTSGIPFSEIQWPYNPHCTLRGGEPLSADAASELASRSFPQEEFWINTVSVYQLNSATFDCKLLCQRTLGA